MKQQLTIFWKKYTKILFKPRKFLKNRTSIGLSGESKGIQNTICKKRSYEVHRVYNKGVKASKFSHFLDKVVPISDPFRKFTAITKPKGSGL